MTVYELNRDQIDELKDAYFWSDDTTEVLEQSNINHPWEIPNEVIYHEYEGICFVPDDFCCSCESVQTMTGKLSVEMPF